MGKEKSLDVTASKDKLMMAKSSNASGQYWKIEKQDNGYYRLTSQYTGKEKSLDVTPQKDKLMMAKSSNASGQFWKITAIK